MADYAAPTREEPTEGTWLAMGTLIFAGSIMIMVGVFQLFQGLAAIVANAYYVISPNYAYRADVTTWGWVHLLLGALVVAAGGYLFVGKLWARIIAIGLAMVSAWVNFLYLPYYPFWSILIIALDVLVIWAVAAHGREMRELTD